LRSAVLSDGAKLLERMLSEVGVGRLEQPLVCSCGERMNSRGLEEKRIKTILGDISFNRSRYVCPVCKATRYRGDEILDVEGTLFSPGVRRFMARAGGRDTFKEGRDDLAEFANVKVTAKQVERVAEKTGQQVETWQQQDYDTMPKQSPEPIAPPPVLYVSYDGTGVPMVPWETSGRKGKQADGSSRTREVKLGCVFTQTTLDDNGYPFRDEHSTSFVGAIETSNKFGERIYAEALRRGLCSAKKVAVIADGARYNWEIAALHFPGAVEIVDLYHAREHLHALSALLEPGGRQKLKSRWLKMLDKGNVKKIIIQAQKHLPLNKQRREDAQKQINYFKNNILRMDYGNYRKQGLFVGSGVVEAGCKTIIGKRLKQSGMQWTVRGANAIIALRCCHLSGRIEDFWEQRAG
jgi:hypothetical protein